MTADLVPPEALATIADLVTERSGMHFAESRRVELVTKIHRAFGESGCASWRTYVDRLASADGAGLLTRLIEMLTIGETYFFRDRAYFETLEREVLPQIVAACQATRQLRCWCAGCATGEEAYSLAIMLHENLPEPQSWDVRILATDLNRSYLDVARQAIYHEWSFRETDDRFKHQYFTPVGARFQLRPEIRRLVQFDWVNLVDESSQPQEIWRAKFELILCRNVLLYLSPDHVRRVIDRLAASLVTDGWLILGPSDPSSAAMRRFDAVVFGGVVLYRRRPTFSVAPLMLVGDRPQLAVGDLSRANDGTTRSDVGDAGDARPDVGSRSPLPSIGAATPPEPEWQVALHDAWQSLRLRNYAAAERHCRQAIALATFQPEPHYVLGLLFQSQGEDDAALEAFRRALYVDRAFVPAQVALAAGLRRNGHARRAGRLLRRAQHLLERRESDEVLLAADGLTVGRLRDALSQLVGADD